MQGEATAHHTTTSGFVQSTAPDPASRMKPTRRKSGAPVQKLKMQGRSLSYADAMQLAASLFGAGNVLEAERVCRHILNAKADDLNALHLLGVLRVQQGNLDEGLACFDHALRAN